MIELLFATSLALVALTKLADLWTTLQNVDRHSETNPLGARLFHRFGERAGVGIVGLLAALLIALSYASAWGTGPVAQVAVAAMGLPIALVQGAVALTNHTGRSNAITRFLADIHRRFPRP